MFYPAQVGSSVVAGGIPIPPTIQILLGPLFIENSFAGIMGAVNSDPHQAAAFLFVKAEPGSQNPFTQDMEANFGVPGVAGMWTEAQANAVIGLTTVPQGFVEGDQVWWALAGTPDINDVVVNHPEIPHSDGQPFPDVPPPQPTPFASFGTKQSLAKQYNAAVAAKKTVKAQAPSYGKAPKIMV